MKLRQLTLTNFQGIREFALDARGEDVSVFGDNGTGKTTLASAISWLLFGKDSLGRAEFALKPLDPYGQDVHNLETRVGAQFLLDDGTELELAKVYREVYTKKRGSAESELSGNTTDHFVDGVPSQQKEYQAKVAAIAAPETFRMLTDPAYFAEAMHWQKRREVLLEVCGDITDADVIATDPELALLPGILGKRSVDDHRKVVLATRKEVNENLTRSPVRIDEAQRSILDELPDTSADEQLAEGLRARIHELQADTARLAAGGQDSELRAQIREAEAALTTATANAQAAAQRETSRLTAEANAERQQALQGLETLRNTVADLDRKVKAAEADTQTERKRVDAHTKTLDSLRIAWGEIEAKEFGGDTHCPTCQQALPADQVKAAREAFNLKQAQDLEANEAQGKQVKAELDSAEAARKVAAASTMDLARQLVDARSKLAAAEAAIPQPVHVGVDPGTTPEMEAAASQLQELKTRLASLATDTTERDRVAAELRQALSDLTAAEERVASCRLAIQASQQARARVEELAEQQKQLGVEFERLERELDLLDRFVRAKVFLLEDSANSRFTFARFKLFHEQQNGGLAPCCEVTYQGIPYNSGLNNGARINVGLDIIRTLGEHYGVTMPVIADNAESVTRLIEIPAQVIRLVVSESDRTLRVEHTRQAMKGVAA